MNAKETLTIGLAIYQDGDSCWFTLESLLAHHPRVQYLVIDNAPASCRKTRSVTNAVGGTYLHRPDLHGTSAPRDALFRLAKTPWVCCIDSHVLIELGGIQALLDWIETNPDSRDLLSGPLVYDDAQTICSHWTPAAPNALWGTWASDPRLADLDPFEIPMQGLGLFAMRRAAWPGFHPKFRGFGGEEGYIHEKVRQRGGTTWCLPALGWRHKFRDVGPGSAAVPYPLDLRDHTWNLLIGHRELGIDTGNLIYDHFGKRLPAGEYDRLVAQAEQVQPFGQSGDRPRRLKLLGVWYTTSEPPVPMLQKSLATISRAVTETMHHDVRIVTSAWRELPGNPFPCALGKPDAQPGHASIIAQQKAAIALAGDWEYDAVVFLEHDVLIGPAHFDRIGDGFLAGGSDLAPVVSNLDYIGMNATGYLAVKERHEPLHQLSVRRDVYWANLERAQADCDAQGWCLLEPQGERKDWIRLPPVGLCPSVHINW